MQDAAAQNVAQDTDPVASYGAALGSSYNPGDLSLAADPGLMSSDNVQPVDAQKPTSKKFGSLVRRLDVILVTLILVGGVAMFAISSVANKRENSANNNSAARQYKTSEIALSDLVQGSQSDIVGTRTLTVNGPLQLNGGLVIAPQPEPSKAVAGQIYYDQDAKQLALYDGSRFVLMGQGSGQNDVLSIAGLSGSVSLGAGLGVVDNQLTNTGVASLGGQNGPVFVGVGLAMSGNTLVNEGVLSLTAGTSNLVINDDGDGNLTINSVGGSGSVASSGGTPGRIAKFTGAQNVEDSLLSESGTTVTVNGDAAVTGTLTLATALGVVNGGTGATSLTANGVVIGQGAGALTSVTAAGPGLCLISTAGAPAFGACSGGGGGVTSLNSLTGTLTLANASGVGTTVTIDDATTAAKGIASFNATNFSVTGGAVNTIQNINSGATPTFAGVNTNTITPGAALTVGISAQTALLQGSTTTITSNGATNDIILNSADTIELVDNTNVTGNLGVSGDLAVNGGDLTSSGALTITPVGALSAGVATQNLTLQGNGSTSLRASTGGNTTIVAFASPTANTTLNFPALSAGTYTVCTTSGNCTGTAATLQSAYDNSSTPEIVLDATRGAVTIRDALAGLGANLLEVQSNDGTATYLAVTSNGVEVTGTATVSGNINSTTGGLQTAGTTRVDASGNLTNIGNLALAGTISGGTTITGSGNINSSAGALQTAGVSRVDNGGNLTNIGTLTLSGAISGGTTITGSGNINSSAGVIQTASTTRIDNSGNLTNIGNLALSGTISGGTTITASGNINTSTGGIQTNGVTRIDSSGNLSNIGSLTAGGSGTLQGGSLTLGTNAQAGSIIFNDGSTKTGTLQVATLANNTVYTLPDPGGGAATICLSTGNCSGVGGGVTTAGGTPGTIPVFTAAQALGDSLLSQASGTVTANGNVDITGSGVLRTAGTTRLDASGNLSNIGNLALAGTISGGTTITASGNINSSAGALQTAGVSRVDNSGNLVNIGNLTGAGAVTIASSGAGNNVTIDGANQFVVQDAALFNALSTFMTDVDLTFADAEDLTISSTVTGSTSVNLIGTILTNNSASGTQNIAFLQNAAGSGATEGLMVLDNADTDTAVTSGLQVTSAAGGIANAIDVSDPDIVTALLFGLNDISGTNFSVTGSSGSLTSAGSGTFQGGTVTAGTTSQAGTLVVSDGSSNTGTLQVAALGSNRTYTFPDADGTVCLSIGNCGGVSVTLQIAYDNSTNPEIVVDAARGALTIRDNSTPIAANLFEVQNNAGGTSYFAVTSSGASVTGALTASGNINSTTGGLQTAGATRVDATGNLTNIGNLALAGTISGGTTITASGNINSSAGALQTAGVSRVDGSGNLVNIGSLTATGALTIASSGGSDITIDGANQFLIQDATVLSSTAVFNGLATLNADVDLVFSETENLSITNTVTGSNSVNVVGAVLTNNSASGTQQVALLQNAPGSGTTEGILVLDNADTDTIIANGLQITSAAGGITNALDVSDPDIVTALLFGLNDISGTNFSVTGSSGSFTSAGSATVQGGSVTVGTSGQAGVLVLSDGSSNIGTLQTAALGSNRTYTFPNADGTVCLTSGNCAGTGSGVTTGGGTPDRLAKFSASQNIEDSSISDDGTNVTTSANLIVQGGDVTVGTTSQIASLLLHDGNGQTTTLRAGDSAGGLTFILPTTTGSANQCLKQSGTGNQLVWDACDGGSGGTTASLQSAYDDGNTITTTSARDIAFTLSTAGTDANFTVTVADDATGFASISRADGTGTNDPAQLLLVQNLDTNRPQPTGLRLQSAGGGLTTAIDASDAEINDALSVGANNIVGTTGNIDFTNFDVAGATGNITAGTFNSQTISSTASFTGTLTVTSDLTLTSGDLAVNGGNISSTGTLSIDPGGALTVGATGQTTLLRGTTTTITSNGGSNNIVLNAAGTIELEDNTNVTGNLDVSGTLNAGTGNAFQVAANGNITAGAYNTNTFTGDTLTFGSAATATIQSAASQALTLTGNAASTWSTSAGNLTVQAATDLNLKAAAGNIVLGTSDTTGTLLVLDIKTDAGDPTGTDGAIYYNSNLGSFRCYQGGVWTNCITASGGFVSLQNAYDNGNTISTDASGDISFTLNNQNFTVASAAGTTGFTTFSLADGSNGSPAAQLVLITNQDINQAVASGLKVTAAAGGITNALDVSGSNITNAINIGGNAIAGTNFSVTAGGAVTAIGVNAGAGLIQGIGGMTVGGAIISLNNNSNFATNINTGTSNGTITLGGGSSPFVLDSTNFDVNSAGALSGITGLSMASGNFTQTGTGTFSTGSGAVSLNGNTTVAANSTLALASGTGVFSQVFSNNANSSAQTLSVTNSNAGGSAVAMNGQDITLVGTATSGGINSNSAIRFANPSAVANNNFYGLNFAGTGYTDILRVNGTQIISGAGILQSAGVSGNYSGITGVGTLTSGALGAGFTTVAVAQGGTGATTFTSNGLLYGNGTGAVQVTAAGTTGQCLNGNTGAAPTWGSCGAAFTFNTAGDSGTSTVANGQTVTVAGGSGLTSVDDGLRTITLSVGAGTGISVDAANVNIDLAASLTWTGTETFSPSGSNDFVVNGDNDSNAQITSTIGADVSQNGLSLILTDNASASTGTLYGMHILNADNGANTGVPDALAAFVNANAAETVPTGLLVEQTGAGTLTNGLEIKRTAGTITNGLAFTGTFGTNIISAPNFTVTNAGGLTAVGVNAGSGLTQGTGGLTITGAVSLNTTGSASTAIGNSTGTFTLDSNTLDISVGGAISGATGLALASGNISQTGTGTFSTGSGAISLNGATTLATNQGLTLQNGTGVFAQTYTNSAAGSAQTLSATNSNAGGSSVAVNGIDLTLVGTATSGGTNTNSAIRFANPSAAANNVFYGLTFAGTGYTDILRVGSTQIINGNGILQSAALSGSYTGITGVGTLTAGALGAGFTAVNVAQGGTGATTFTTNGVLFGSGTSAVQATAAGTTGQCLIGNTGAAPTWSSCSGFFTFNTAGDSGTSAVASTQTVTIAGGSGLVSADNGSRVITLNVGAGTGISVDATNVNIDQTASLTWTGLETFTPSGTNDLVFNGDDDSNAQINSTIGADVSQNGMSLTLTDNANASTGTVYGLHILNANNGANTGVPDALAALINANAAETVPTGLLVEQTGAGTLTNGLEIKRTAGTITNGLAFTGTFGTNIISAPNFTVTNAGGLTAVGVNAGSGLTQGTGGLTITGAVSLNTTGSASTAIGNATGTFTLDSNTLDISVGGAISGATGLSLASGNISQTGTGTFSTGSGAISLNGATTLATNQGLTLQNGTGVFAQTYSSAAAGSAQVLSATNTNAGGSSVAVNGIDVTLVGTATSGGVNSNSALRFANPSAAANNVFYGLNFAGTGYTDILRVNGSQIINGNGVLQSAALSGSYTGITGVGTLTAGALGAGFTAVNVAQGGTGATTFTTNGVLFGNGTGAVQVTAAGTTGQCLNGNTSAAPTWGACGTAFTFNTAGDSGTSAVTTGQTVTVAGGSGLVSADNGSRVITLNVGAGTGISVDATNVNIDQTASLTWTGLETFTPTSTNDLVFNGDNDSNLQVNSTIGADVSQNGLSLVLTDNASASTGTLYALSATNADNGANTGVPDAVGYFGNANAAETVPSGVLVEQTGAGTLTNGLEIKRTAGTITNGLTFTGTFGTNLINATNFTVTNAGALSAVGINAGSGLIQGTGGLTITGAGSINTTGSASTAIGNSTGTFTLDSNTLDVSVGGAISGATGLALASGNISQTGTGTLSTGSGTVSLNGDTNVAAGKNLTLQSGAGVFAQTFSSASAASAQTLSVTNTNAGGSAVAVNAHDITLVGTATSGGVNSNSAIRFANPSAAANNVFYGLNFAGTGYTDILRVNGAQIISGTGVLQSAGISGSYSSLTGTGTLTSGALGAGFTAVNVAQGGTGATTLASNGVLYGGGTGAIQATAVGTTGQCLNGNTGAAPTWGSCGSFTGFNTAGDSGTSAVTNGQTVTVAGGNGLASTDNGSRTITLNVGAGTGISVDATNVNVDVAASLTWTGTETFTPSGTNNFVINGDDNSNAQINSTIGADVSQSGLLLTVTDNASASTGTLYGLNVTNANNGANTGVPDAIGYFQNANAAETVPTGVLIEQTGAGTMTNGLEIKRTAGAVTNGLTFTGTFGTNLINATNFSVTNAGAGTFASNLVVQGTTGLTFNTGAGGDITFANSEKIDNDTDGQINLQANSGALTLLLTGTAATVQNSAGTLTLNSFNNVLTVDATDTTFTTGFTTVTLGSNASIDSAGTITLNPGSNVIIPAADTFQSDDVTSTGALSLVSASASNLNLSPGTTGDVVATHGNNSNFQIGGTQTSDNTLNLVDVTLTNNISASTGTLYGLQVNNADNGGNTGVADAIARFINNQATETLADGVLVQNNPGSGTLTNAIRVLQNTAGSTTTNGIMIQNSAGTLTNGLQFSGSMTNGIYFASASFSGADIRKDTTGFSIDLNNASPSTLSVTNGGAGVASISIEAGGSYTGAGAVTVSSGGSAALGLDSASGRVGIATGDFLSTSVSGVTGAAAGDIWYDSAAGKYKINEGGTTKTLCNLTDLSCGAGGGGGVTTVGAFSGSSQTNGANITGTTITFGPADGTNPGMVSTGSQTFAGNKTFTGQLIQNSDSASAFTLLDSTATYSNLTFDSSTNHLKVYDHSMPRTAYVDIYYAGSTAVIAASTGATQVGNGTGDVNVSLTNNAERFNFAHTGTNATSSDIDFFIQRNLTGGSNNLQGAVLKVEDISTFSGGSSSPDVLSINQNNTGATGNLIVARLGGGSNDKFKVNTAGTVTIAAAQSYTGAGAVTLSSGAGTALSVTGNAASTWSTTSGDLTIQAAGTSSLNLDTGGAGTVSVGGTNATTVAIATNATAHTINVGNGGADNDITIGSTNSGSSVTMQAGTGGLTLTTQGTGVLGIGTNAVAQTINIGNATGATIVNIKAGTGNVTIGTSDTTGTPFVLDDKTGAGDPGTVPNGGMYYNSNQKRFKCAENGAWKECSHRTVVRLTGDVTNANGTANTMEDVTGLSWTAASGTMYNFTCQIYYTSAATTTGSRWAMNGPATTALMYQSEYTLTATTSTRNAMVQAYDSPAASNASSASGGNLAILTGFILPSANGTIIVRHASEVISSTITAKAGSTCEYW